MQICETIWQANRRLNENGVKDKAAMQRAGGMAGRGVIIENRDFEEVIRRYDSKGTLNYVDPPYYGTEKHYEARFSKEDHYRLRHVLGDMEGMFMLSYNDCGFIRDLYSGYYIESVGRLNSISQRYNPGGQFRELLVMNYNPYERRDKQPKQMTLAM
ncbi:MAG: DNA adenine methylase [Anaerotignum sp.]|jgi:DNA adenine methylase|nr:DNA adenine methylase [Anaerotignum sp.]